jgi:two-component system chemotaxis response regulator CheY
MSADWSTLNVLVAEDMGSMRMLIKATLKSLGVTEINTVPDGGAAIKALESERYDLVLCDWDMPGASGLEVLQSARGSETNPKVPFVMLTGNTQQEHVSQAIQAGVDDFVAKPFKTETLEEKIEQLLKKVAGVAGATG